MNKGITTMIYPVTDLDQAKAMFQTFLGVEAYVESSYYVGFKVGEQDIGLDPNTHKAGMIAYYQVGNIKESLQSLVDAGAEIQKDVNDVGGGRLMASVTDANGNIIGLLQDT